METTTTRETPQGRVKEAQEEEEIILGSFSSNPAAQGAAGSYHVYVTNKRVIGIKIPPTASPPKVAKDLDNPELGRVDFSIPRGAIANTTMRSAGKNRNVFVIQIRGGRALKILLKHSSDKELQKEKELFIDSFRGKTA
jgi:hypothetical protein